MKWAPAPPAGLRSDWACIDYVSCTVHSTATCNSAVRHCVADGKFKITGPVDVDAGVLHRRAAQQRNNHGFRRAALRGQLVRRRLLAYYFAACIVSTLHAMGGIVRSTSSPARKDVTLGSKPLVLDSRHTRSPNFIS